MATVDGAAFGGHYSAGKSVVDEVHGFEWTVCLRSSTDSAGSPGPFTVRRSFQRVAGEQVFLINECPPLSQQVGERLAVLAQLAAIDASVTAGQTVTEWTRTGRCCVRCEHEGHD